MVYEIIKIRLFHPFMNLVQFLRQLLLLSDSIPERLNQPMYTMIKTRLPLIMVADQKQKLATILKQNVDDTTLIQAHSIGHVILE